MIRRSALGARALLVELRMGRARVLQELRDNAVLLLEACGQIPGYAFAGDHPRWTEEETFARLTPPDVG